MLKFPNLRNLNLENHLFHFSLFHCPTHSFPFSLLLSIDLQIPEARYAQKNNINPMIMMREDSLIDISNKYFDDIPCIIQLNELKFAKEKDLKLISRFN